jgi:hypothetical protein
MEQWEIDIINAPSTPGLVVGPYVHDMRDPDLYTPYDFVEQVAPDGDALRVGKGDHPGCTKNGDIVFLVRDGEATKFQASDLEVSWSRPYSYSMTLTRVRCDDDDEDLRKADALAARRREAHKMFKRNGWSR